MKRPNNRCEGLCDYNNQRKFASELASLLDIVNGTCITIMRSMTRIKEAKKALESSLVGIKSLLISSQLT